MEERESVISKLEEADMRMRASGLQRGWFANSDKKVYAVAGHCNGVLLETLLRATNYSDWEACNLLRNGISFCIFSLCAVCHIICRSRSAYCGESARFWDR